MAASLRSSVKNGCRLLNNLRMKLNPTQAKHGEINLGQQVCRMSEKRTLQILPSRYEWNQFKDHLQFYFSLHLIPMGAIIAYINITRGRCKLQDIPEDYEPKYWEYYKHPITQFLARNFFRSPEEEYERYLHVVYTENEKRKLRILEEKVRTLQAKRGDYKGWYYVPINPNPTYAAHQQAQSEKEKDGI